MVRAVGSSENETIVVVRPWKLPRQTTIFARPGADPLDLVTPLARRLDRGLDGLGARVHRQHPLRRADLGEALAELAEAVVAEGAAGEGQAIELLVCRRDQPRVAVAEVERRVGRQGVEVAAPLDVLDPRALAPGDDHGEGVVVVDAVLLLEQRRIQELGCNVATLTPVTAAGHPRAC